MSIKKKKKKLSKGDGGAWILINPQFEELTIFLILASWNI